MKPRRSMREWAREAIERRWRITAGVCLKDEELLDFYSGALEEAAESVVREHLVTCAQCRERARYTRTFVNVMCQPPSARPVRFGGFSWILTRPAPLLMAAAATVMIALGVALLLRPPHHPGIPPAQEARSSTPPPIRSETPATNPWKDLVIAKAEYSPPVAGPDEMFYRDGRGGPKTQSTLPLAMEPYERNDFAEAERRLAEFVARNPQAPEAHFYRGVSMLLLNRLSESVAPFQAAIQTGKGAVVEEARWYLALALLKDGQSAKALEQLESLSGTVGARRAEAEKLREQVRAKAQETR